MTNTQFINRDDHPLNQSVTYWFRLNGTDHGTGIEFENGEYGVTYELDNEDNEDMFLVAFDGTPINKSDGEGIAVLNALEDQIQSIESKVS